MKLHQDFAEVTLNRMLRGCLRMKEKGASDEDICRKIAFMVLELHEMFKFFNGDLERKAMEKHLGGENGKN